MHSVRSAVCVSGCKTGRQQSRSAFLLFGGRGRIGARGGAEAGTQSNRDRHHIMSRDELEPGRKPEHARSRSRNRNGNQGTRRSGAGAETDIRKLGSSRNQSHHRSRNHRQHHNRDRSRVTKIAGAGAPLQSCSSRSRKHRVAIKPAVRTRSGDFFRYTDAGKILLLGRLPGRVMFGRLQWIRDGRAGFLFLLQSHPARRHGGGTAGRTCSVQVGRGKEAGIVSAAEAEATEPHREGRRKKARNKPEPQRTGRSNGTLKAILCPASDR